VKTEQRNEFICRLKELSSCVLADTMDELGIKATMSSSIKPVKSGIKLVGPVVTIRRIKKEKIGEGDFSKYAKILHETIYSIGPGDIIAIDADGDTESASWGGNMSTAAKLNSLGGAIIDGGARDRQEIVDMEFPIFCKSFVPSAGTRLVTIGYNVPIICGGILIFPGDFVFGDDDGVVVIPKNRLEEVLILAEKIEYKERKIMEYLNKGYKLPEAIEKFKIK
jgi:regulator of RNase E activity RraA